MIFASFLAFAESVRFEYERTSYRSIEEELPGTLLVGEAPRGRRTGFPPPSPLLKAFSLVPSGVHSNRPSR